MTPQNQYRPVNPRLGTHYATFASAIAAVVLVLAMVEQLGARKLWLSHVMIAAPLVLYITVAAITRTVDLHEFFSAGRRVPAVFGGLSLAATAIGGAGFFALTGCLYLIGFDALCLLLGWLAGFAVCTALFTPYLRKSGAYTLPAFFRQRFASPAAGAAAAILLLPPVLLLLAAELRIGAFVASLFVSVSFETAVSAGAAIVAILAILGGMRSVSWTQCSLYIVVIGAFLLPLAILSVQLTNLPLPQLTYSWLFDDLSAREMAAGAVETRPTELELALPGERPQAALKPFLQQFGAISETNFLMLVFCFMAGTAAMPSLLMRAGTAPSVFEARRAIGWGMLFLGLFLISIPAYAAFTKFLMLEELASAGAASPDWVIGLREAGLADFLDRDNDGQFGVREMLMSRDGVTLSLPIMAGYPFVIAALVAVGGISATLAAAAAHTLAAGASVSEDLLQGLLPGPATPGKRLLAARLGVIAAAAGAALFVSQRDFDILPFIAWSMSLAGSAFLPALALAIWWPRMTALGVLAAMLAGFAVAAGNIALTATGVSPDWFGLSNLVAGVYGAPAGFAAGVGVSYLTGPPPAATVKMAEEIRDPSGETIQDRAVRLSAGGADADADGDD